MQSKSLKLHGCLSAILIVGLIASVVEGQQKQKPQRTELTPKQLAELEKKGRKPPTGATFYIDNESGGAPGRFSLLLTDENRQFATQSYSLDQLNLVQAVIDEAHKFAYTAEGSGNKKPVTTRFFDKQEPSFVVDVSKLGAKSQFYVTLVAIDGTSVTIDAGVVNRDDRGSKTVFHTIIEKIEAARANVK
jgi:hypothetical protein